MSRYQTCPDLNCDEISQHVMLSCTHHESILSNSNWTEWSTIQGVIVQVLSKSDKHEVRGQFEITGTITL